MIRIIDDKQSGALLARRRARLAEAEQVVAPILDAVRRRGDRALVEYARRFDGLERGRKTVQVAPEDLEAAYRALPAGFRSAVRVASRNIRNYARLQVPVARVTRMHQGHRTSQIIRPLDAMETYVPSGRYPLPSTLLMTLIPAQVAGVQCCVVASPRPSPEILGIAHFLKARAVYRMGGAHAIAAFAFGTDTVPKVDRIVGPGNIYVAAAKKLLAGEVGIDFIAGPTEILIVSGDGDPRVLAADMLAQAEHDTDASAILLTTSRKLATSVAKEIERQLESLPTTPTASESIRKNGAIIIVKSLERAMEISNRFAPEHLSIPDRSLLKLVTAAGGVFVGPYSPEAAGDYASGPNHVLPTSGAARVRAGLSAADFVRVISVQELDAASLGKLTPAITTLARAEGVEAHARSVEVRTREQR